MAANRASRRQMARLLLLGAHVSLVCASECTGSIQTCDNDMRKNIGGTVQCDKCVCKLKDPSDKNCENDKNQMCEASQGFDGTQTYNCAPPPEKCFDKIEECGTNIKKDFEDTAFCAGGTNAKKPCSMNSDCPESVCNGLQRYVSCDNCVCRDEIGTSCASTADCLAICNEGDCNEVNRTEYAYECVAAQCGDKVKACFDAMNSNPGAPVTCDNCVCANSRHMCQNSVCQMTCHDRKGCYSFSNPNLVYGCQARGGKEKSDGGEIAGIIIAVIAIVSLGFALYYYTQIAPRLSRIPNDLLADPLVDNSELSMSAPQQRSDATGVGATSERAIKGVTQDQYNEL